MEQCINPCLRAEYHNAQQQESYQMASLFTFLRRRLSSLHKSHAESRKPTKTDSFALLKSLKIPVGSIIDVGVHEATQELIRAYPDVPHLLCEPIAEFHPIIRENYLGHVRSFLIIPYAVGKESKDIYMETRSVTNDLAITHARVKNGSETQENNPRKITMKTLDAIMADLDFSEPYLLKIDIDGPDVDVILGAKETLKNCSVICIEAGVKDLHQRLSVIRQYGFELYDIVDICYYDNRLIQMDAIFIRSDLIKSLGLSFYKDGFDINLWQSYL